MHNTENAELKRARHEAGHAIVGFAVGRVPVLATLGDRPRVEWDGSPPASAAQWYTWTATALGGLAGAFDAGHGVNWRNSADAMQARAIAELAVKRWQALAADEVLAVARDMAQDAIRANRAAHRAIAEAMLADGTLTTERMIETAQATGRPLMAIACTAEGLRIEPRPRSS